MAKVDQVTVEALQLTAPWASTLDAKILRGKVLGGEIFCRFSQQEREGIWNRLQSFKDLVPSLFEFFENVKCLEAWADCLKWLVCLGPRETLSTAMNKIYTGINQSVDSALVQENETTFKSVPASSARRIDLGYRQLRAFAMRYHCEIPKKPSGKDLLAKPRAMSDTTRLREMADLADCLGFESSEITALKQFSKSADPTIVGGNERPALVTDGPGETRKDRCGMPHVQNYEEDRKFLFITHLHDDRDEQFEGITSYFRLRSTYLKFYGMPDDSNPQQHLTTVTGELLSPAISLTRSAYSSREDQTRGAEHMEIDREQTEDTTMQEGEGEGEEQRPSFQPEGALTQEASMQRQNLLSDAGMLGKKEYEQEQYRQKLAGDANALVEEEQRLEQKRQKLLSDASTLEKQEQEQEQRQRKLLSHANIIEKQEQEQEQQRQKLLSDVITLEKQEQEYRQKLVGDAGTLREQEQEQEQERQKLLSDVSTLEKQEQEQEKYRQKLTRDAIALREQEHEQERRRQKLISDASALKEREQEQEQMYQKLTGDASVLREQEQGREKQRQTLAREENELMNRKQKQEEQRQTLATVAGELVNQEQRQEEQRQKLAEYANDLKDQELRQNGQRQKLTADISELNKQEKRHKKLKRDKLKQKREQKSVEQKVLGSKQDELRTIQERDERDMGELQRQSQEELADLELPSPLELEHEGVYADQSTPEVRAENYSMDAVQKGGIQMDVSAPEGEDIPVQEHGPQQNRTQVKGQEERHTEETQDDRLHEPEAQETGQEHGVQGREHEHQTQEDRQEGRAHGDEAHEDGAYEDGAHEDGVDEDEAYEDAAHDDKAQGGRQADEAQEVVQEDKAHKEGQDSGAHEDDIREYRAGKRRAMTDESDDGAALRAQQVREGRKPVEKGKFQRLNRFGSSNHDMNPEGDTSMDGTGEGDTTPMQRKKPQTSRRQQRQDLQAQQRTTNATAAVMTETTNGSTGLASDFTYEAPSRAT